MHPLSQRLAAVLVPAIAIGLNAGCSGHRTDADDVTEIHGELSLAELVEPLVGATVVVSAVGRTANDVEEVLTTQTHTGVSMTSTQDRLAFALRVPRTPESTEHAITAHVDSDGDEAVSPRDYVTRRPFPVDLSRPGVQASDLELTLYPVR